MKIAKSELAPGAKLPSVRGLAMQLTINTNTVAKAYKELASLGLVESKNGLGLFVCEPKKLLNDSHQQQLLNDATADFASKIFGLNISKQEILQHLVKELDAVLPPDTLDKKGN
jgi:GntR family transcriptional regulator